MAESEGEGGVERSSSNKLGAKAKSRAFLRLIKLLGNGFYGGNVAHVADGWRAEIGK